MMKIDWRKIAPYLVAIVVFLGLALIYCSPLLEGKVLYAGDVNNWKGAEQEAIEYRAQTGETTWWTNSMFGGMPTYQVSGSTPANRLRGTLETITHFGFMEDRAAIGLLLAYLFGFFFMLRCFNVNPWLSIVGAFALTLSSYYMLIIPAGHMTKASALGCLAPMIGGIYAVFRKKYWLGAPLILIYGVIGITLHPQMTYYMMLLIAVMGCAEVYIHAREKRWKDLTIGAAICVACALLIFGTKLSWWQMNNEYLKETMRGGHSELRSEEKTDDQKAGLDIKYATDWSYGQAETLTLLIPNFMGGASGYHLDEKSLLYKELVSARVPKNSAKQFCQSAPTYWGEKMFTSGAVYVGAVVCFLFVLGLLIVPGAYKWGLLFATIASILLAWGRNFMPLTEWFFYHFPMYNKFRTVESILVVAEVTIPLLGFLGLQHIWEQQDSKAKYGRQVLIAAGITAGLCLILALFGGSMFSFTSSYDNQWKGQVGNDIYQMIIDQRIAMMKSDAWRSFGLIAAAAVVIWLYTQDKLKSAYAVSILAVLILVDMVPVDRRFFGSKDFITPKDNNRYFAMQPWEEQILKDKSLDYRVLNLTTSTFNDARTSYRLKSIGGYSAVKLRRYQDLIDEHISKMNWNVLNMLNTKYVVARQGVHSNPDAMGNAWFVNDVQFVPTPDDEIAALNTLDLQTTAVADELFREVLTCEPQPSETDQIALTAYQPNKLTYTANVAHDRVAVFSEIYYPHDWHLYCDGEELPLGRVNYTLRAAVIPAGEHSIYMEFVPSALQTDKWCMALLILLLLFSLGSLGWYIYKQ